MKKFLSFALSAVILMSGLSESVFAEGERSCDVNGDGTVSLCDAVSVYRHVFKYETEFDESDDINGDDRINALDAAEILKHLAENDIASDTEYENVTDADVINDGFFFEAEPIVDGEWHYVDGGWIYRNKLTLNLYERSTDIRDVFARSLYIDYSDGLILEKIEYSEDRAFTSSNTSVSPVTVIAVNRSLRFPENDSLLASLTFSIATNDDISVNIGIGEAVNIELEEYSSDDFGICGFKLVKGDVDGNGKLNLSDVSETLKYIAGWYCCVGYEIFPMDMNGDSKLNLADASLMMKRIAGWKN